MPRDRGAGTFWQAGIWLLFFALLVPAGAVGWAIGHQSGTSATTPTTAPSGNEGVNPSDPHVAMGAHLFVQFACSACHGEQGEGGVSPDVPALTDVGKSLP